MVKRCNLFILTILSFANLAFGEDSFLDRYKKDITSGVVSDTNALSYIRNIENKLYSEMSVMFEELQFDHHSKSYFSPKDKVHEFTTKWKRHTKQIDLRKLLLEISSAPRIPLKNESIRKRLKENRKFVQILRENFYIFDRDHDVPKKLNNIVKPFGKLNDAIVAGNENLIQEYALKVAKGVKKLNINKIVREFHYISKDEFDEYFKVLQKDFKSMLSKQKHSIHDFHWIRKQHKKFLVIYMGSKGNKPHLKASLLDDYITKIGDMNDIYVDIEMRFNLNLDNHTIKMNESFRKQMVKTLSALRRDMKDIKLGPSCYSIFAII